MKNTILISRNEIIKILELMNKFPKDSNYTLEYESCEIGYTIDMIVPLSVQGIEGEFKISICDSRGW